MFSPHTARSLGAVLVAALCALPAGTSPLRAQSAMAAAPHRAPYSAPAGSNLVTVTAHDFALQMPDSIPAGLTTFRLLNDGKQSHHMEVVRLDSGSTGAEALAALIAAGRGVRPSWMHFVGGPNEMRPSSASNATLVLEPGNYLAFCEIPGPDPRPHFMKGMVKAFTVIAPARDAALPSTDLTITMSDYSFTFSHSLTSGHRVIAVKNSAAQPHMMVIHREAPGEGAKEFLAWGENPNGEPQPGAGWGGVTTIAPGETVVFEEDFPPGRYFLICFTPDAKDGKPHFAHGMLEEFDVK
jgi:hypothetical protein